ncbi:hypothetical protein [Flavobacterium crassostreae]|uniref:Lipopolysaccharide biosynthesis protein n=1 Tax=Flavobacterium crassostreae TaxID=1763534 RepID=A0A1B9E9V0_9FLAO|nr:hypothetical protein [Flavobacterium crassostreae]OCB78713.1 hypothetical protein LPBF_01590 [Flavobacterium crassostreae]
MKKQFEGKKIILAITSDFKIYECFIENLNLLGFETVLLCDNTPFRYKSNTHKVISFLRKVFLGDKSYKKKLQSAFRNATYLDTLHHVPNDFDYGLVIRPDLFDQNILELVQQKTKELYAYQWDGLNRFPMAATTIPLFKKFYVFDKQDLVNNPKVSILNNFYFDCYTAIFDSKKPAFDVYYLGSFDDRMDTLLVVCEQLHKLGLKLNINIMAKKSKAKKLKQYPYINILKKPISFKENLVHVANTKIILDMAHDSLHKGLSFRPFEALGYHKKLITTNTAIKDYDFYTQNNIHIYDNPTNLALFIKTDLVEIKPEIKHKYSFSYWIEHTLQITGSQP